MAVPRTLNLNHFKKNTRLSQEIQDFLTKHKTFSRNTRLSQETQDFHTKHKTFTRITRLSQKTQDFHKKHKTFTKNTRLSQETQDFSHERLQLKTSVIRSIISSVYRFLFTFNTACTASHFLYYLEATKFVTLLTGSTSLSRF